MPGPSLHAGFFRDVREGAIAVVVVQHAFAGVEAHAGDEQSVKAVVVVIAGNEPKLHSIGRGRNPTDTSVNVPSPLLRYRLIAPLGR